jgi:hypothetical protein
MTPFLDFIHINRHTPDASSDDMLYDLTKIPEAMAAFHYTVVMRMLQSLHVKGIRILSIIGNDLQLQRIALSDEDGSECFENWRSAAAEFSYVE